VRGLGPGPFARPGKGACWSTVAQRVQSGWEEAPEPCVASAAPLDGAGLLDPSGGKGRAARGVAGQTPGLQGVVLLDGVAKGVCMDGAVILRFEGQLGLGFAEFARHRAARLALGMDVLGLNAGTARVAVWGQPDLVDAFEMAMSLGPGDCLVARVTRETNDQGE
jgi:hypothetical protein